MSTMRWRPMSFPRGSSSPASLIRGRRRWSLTLTPNKGGRRKRIDEIGKQQSHQETNGDQQDGADDRIGDALVLGYRLQAWDTGIEEIYAIQAQYHPLL